MRNTNFYFLTIIFIILISRNTVSSQITTNEIPYSIQHSIHSLRSSSIPLKIEAPNLEKITNEDIENEKGPDKLIRIGVPLPVNKDINNSGEWIVLENGDMLWQLTITVEDAKSLDLIFDKFWLPQGGKFFLFNPSTTQTIGAITSEFINGSQSNPSNFSTGFIYGDKMVLEYYQPVTTEEKPIISISNIYYGYRYINNPYEKTGNIGDSEGCNITAACKSNWNIESNSVARILIKTSIGSYWCSGSLVNNTLKDNSPLLLTANHCLANQYDAMSNTNLSTSIFYWNFADGSCESNSNKNDHSFYGPEISTTGAMLKANNSSTDFALLELIQDPRNVATAIHYAGWDATGNSGVGGACIHHPSGDLRKISIFTMTPQSTNYGSGSTSGSGSHWRVQWSEGITEGGSSGSPLINNEKKIIGQLHGGTSSCTNMSGADWYGKFNLSWTGSGSSDSRRRLKDWLDPLNTNSLKIDGISKNRIIGPVKLSYMEIADYSLERLTRSFLSLNGVSSNLTIINYNSRSNIATIQATGTGIGYIYASDVTGSVSVPITIMNAQRSSLSQTSNYLISSKDGVISINQENNEKTISDKPEVMLYELYNPYSGILLKNGKVEGDTRSIDLSRFQKGIYILKIKTDNEATSHKILIQ